MTEKSYILGVDPAKLKFDATLIGLDARCVFKPEEFAMTREGFDKLKARLIESLPTDAHLTVGVEATGALDDNLLAWLYGRPFPFASTVIRLNAACSANFSGPKPARGGNDQIDARRAAEFTRVYAARLHTFQHDAEAQAWVRQVNERAALERQTVVIKNQLKDHLVISFPEFTQVFADPFGAMALVALRAAPTAAHAARKRPAPLARLKTSGGRALGLERAQRLIALAKDSIASATSDADAETLRFMADHLDLLHGRIQAIERSLKECRLSANDGGDLVAAGDAPSIPEQMRALFSIKGVADVGAATVIFRSKGLARFTNAQALSAQLGACPEHDQTGHSRDASRLSSCGDRRARCTLYMLTQSACQNDPVFAFHKWRHQRQGHTPKQAVCACMNRLARLMWTLAMRRATYNVNHGIGQIVIHHNSLWKIFVQEHRDVKNLWKTIDEKWLKAA